jgi:hypothetical protein
MKHQARPAVSVTQYLDVLPTHLTDSRSQRFAYRFLQSETPSEPVRLSVADGLLGPCIDAVQEPLPKLINAALNASDLNHIDTN